MKNISIKIILTLAVFYGFSGCKKVLTEDEQKDKIVLTSNQKYSETKLLSTDNKIKVMSFNIRHNNTADPQSLTQRQGNIRQIIVDNNPDVVGLQEFSDDYFESWFRVQMSNLGYGEYYDTTITGSPKIIFFKNSRFVLQSSGTAYLGFSKSGTWVVLLDNLTSLKYFISNSHWKHDSATERLANSQALVTSIQLQNTQNLPEIVFGDFNAIPGTAEINYLKNSLDLVDALGDQESELTFHGWDEIGNSKIDWMMSSRDMSYTSAKVIKTSYGGYWPSDHWPIMASYIPAIFGKPQTDVNGKSIVSTTKYFFADVNGDGKEDKIYWRNTFDGGKPQVFLSNGNGTFAVNAVVHSAGASTLATTRYYYADVNGDGKADQILWDPTLNAGHTRVYLATTNGNFSATVKDNPEGTSVGATTVYNFADVNGDGKADKIYWNSGYDSGHTRVYLATTAGGFNPTTVSGPEGASTTPGTTFYYADVNGDGKADKIIWRPTLSAKTEVYLSDGDGTFTASSSFTDSGAGSTKASTKFYFTDVNGDGKADKIYWNPGNYLGKPKFYLSIAGNVFGEAIYSLQGTSESANTFFYFADINGDGKSDQIRWNYGEYDGELRNYFAK